MADFFRIMVLADSRSFHTERYVRELQKQGCEVLLISLEAGEFEHRSLTRRGPVRRLHYHLALPELTRHIKEWLPDIVNAHFASGYGWLAARALNNHDIPLALHLWGSDILIVPHKSYFHRRKTTRAITRADIVFGDSEYLLNEARKYGGVGRTEVIPWGIEREFLRLYRERPSWSRPVKVLCSRPHESLYGNEIVLGALSPLIEQGEVQLTVPTWGAKSARFRRLAGRQINHGIRMYPRLVREAYLKQVAEHDLFVSASLSDSSPASLIESMALGLVPIVADIPGVREWGDQGAILFNGDRSDDLRENVKAVIASDGPDGELLKRNHERVVSNAVFEENICRTIGALKDLAGAGGAR